MSTTVGGNPVHSPVGWTPVPGGDPADPPAAFTKDLLVEPDLDSFVLFVHAPLPAMAAPDITT